MKNPINKSIFLLIITVILCFTTSCQSPIYKSKLEKTLDKPISKTMTLEEATKVIEGYGISTSSSVQFENKEKYFDDTILNYNCRDVHHAYSILASDRSLVFFGTNEIDYKTPIELSKSEIKQKVKDYINKIYHFNDVEIMKTKQNEIDSLIRVKGVMGDVDRPFEMLINGKGELGAITSFPRDVNIEEGMSQDSAREESLQIISQQVQFCDLDKLVLINESITDDWYPMYFFEYEYRQDSPTAEKFDFDCQIKIKQGNGKMKSIWVNPILDNIDIIKIEEATELAKKHIAEKKGIDLSKLKHVESRMTVCSGMIYYDFEFHYTEHSNKYVFYMLPATNEFSKIDIEPIDQDCE